MINKKMYSCFLELILKTSKKMNPIASISNLNKFEVGQLTNANFSHPDGDWSFYVYIHPETKVLWFSGKDIANCLKYKDTKSAIQDYVDSNDKLSWKLLFEDGRRCATPLKLPANWQPQKVMINETGLYELILSSRLPNAKQYRRWICQEVLPAINRTGQFQMNLTNDVVVDYKYLYLESQLKIRDKDVELANSKCRHLQDKLIQTQESFAYQIARNAKLKNNMSYLQTSCE